MTQTKINSLLQKFGVGASIGGVTMRSKLAAALKGMHATKG